MKMTGEDKTHLERLQTSPSKLAKEGSSAKDEVPLADGGYLVETQVRRAKSFLRVVTHFACPTVANISSGSWAVPCIPTATKLGEQGPDGEEDKPPPWFTGKADRACPCTTYIGWKMMLQGGPCPW